MLRRDELYGDWGSVIEEFGRRGQSNKSLISLAAEVLAPATRPSVQVPVWRFRKNGRMFEEKSTRKRNRGGPSWLICR
jgi:hypothetical protein